MKTKQYINKDEVVAELKRKIKFAQTFGDDAFYSSMQQFYDGIKETCNNLLSFLNTLKVFEQQQKQGWSEKDEKMLKDTIIAVWNADYYTFKDKQKIETWLNILKRRLLL